MTTVSFRSLHPQVDKIVRTCKASRMHTPRKHRVRLSESEAISIFKLKTTTSAICVAKLYDVSEKAVRDIWTRRTWANETWYLNALRPLSGNERSKWCEKIALNTYSSPVKGSSASIEQTSCPEISTPGNEHCLLTCCPFPKSTSVLQCSFSETPTLGNKQCFLACCPTPKRTLVLPSAQVLPLLEENAVDTILFSWERKSQSCLTDPFAQDWVTSLQRFAQTRETDIVSEFNQISF